MIQKLCINIFFFKLCYRICSLTIEGGRERGGVGGEREKIFSLICFWFYPLVVPDTSLLT